MYKGGDTCDVRGIITTGRGKRSRQLSRLPTTTSPGVPPCSKKMNGLVSKKNTHTQRSNPLFNNDGTSEKRIEEKDSRRLFRRRRLPNNMRLKHAHQPIYRRRPGRRNITRMVYPTARILQNSRQVRHRCMISIPIKRRLTLES